MPRVQYLTETLNKRNLAVQLRNSWVSWSHAWTPAKASFSFLCAAVWILKICVSCSAFYSSSQISPLTSTFSVQHSLCMSSSTNLQNSLLSPLPYKRPRKIQMGTAGEVKEVWELELRAKVALVTKQAAPIRKWSWAQDGHGSPTQRHRSVWMRYS